MHTDAYCIHLRVRQRKTQHTNHRYNRIRNLFVFFVCVHLSVCAPFDLLLSISTLYILYTYYFLPVCLSSIYCLPLTINPPPFAAASQALNWNLNKFIWNKYFFFVCFFIYNIYIYIYRSNYVSFQRNGNGTWSNCKNCDAERPSVNVQNVSLSPHICIRCNAMHTMHGKCTQTHRWERCSVMREWVA